MGRAAVLHEILGPPLSIATEAPSQFRTGFNHPPSNRFVRNLNATFDEEPSTSRELRSDQVYNYYSMVDRWRIVTIAVADGFHLISLPPYQRSPHASS